MRTIKFRGKRIDTGEWVYGYLVIDPKGEYRIYWKPFEGATSNTYHFVIPESVGQFTGLNDRNELEIYEGNIVKTNYYSGTPGIFKRLIGFVKYHEPAFVVEGIHKYEGLREPLHRLTEVIGNIIDNPELLKP